MKKVCSNCKTENLDYAKFCESCGNELNESVEGVMHEEEPSNRNWRLINSLWIILTFTILLNWVAFLYTGINVRQRKWILSGIIYALPLTLLVLFLSIANDLAVGLIAILMLITSVISIIHAFMIRSEYLIRLEAKQEINNANRDNLKRKLKEEYKQSTQKAQTKHTKLEQKETSPQSLKAEPKNYEKNPEELPEYNLKKSDNSIACDNCKSQNSIYAKFCTKCGLKLNPLQK